MRFSLDDYKALWIMQDRIACEIERSSNFRKHILFLGIEFLSCVMFIMLRDVYKNDVGLPKEWDAFVGREMSSVLRELVEET